MDKKKTGNLIREARVNKNLTQTELGDLLGVSNKAVSRWENGDSFPDVSIIENVANILDIKIQDIITGELGAKEDKTITEAIRDIKFQLAGRKREMLESLLAIILLFICIWIGYLGTSGKSTTLFYHTYTDFTLTLIFSEIIFIVLFKSRIIIKEKDNLTQRKIFTALSFITLIFGIFAPYITMLMVLAHNNPFGMPDSKIGPFVSYQLLAVFIINMIILGINIYQYIRFKVSLGFENYIAIISIFISALWNDWTHRLADISAAFYSLYIRAAIVSVNIVVFLMVIKLTKRYSK